MNDYFNSLEKIIVELSPDQASNHFKTHSKTDLLSKIEQEIQGFDQVIFDKVARMHDSAEAAGFVQEAHWSLNHLLSKVISFEAAVGLSPKTKILYQNINLIFANALNSIVKRFAHFFNPDTPLPIAYGKMATLHLEKKVLEIKKEFSKTRVQKPLLNIALRPVLDRVADPAGITYRELAYYRMLTEKIFSIKSEPLIESYMLYDFQVVAAQLKAATITDHRINILLNILLLHLNFNSTDYISFCIASLQRKLSMLPSEMEKVGYLRLYQKLLNQVIIQPGAKLLPQSPAANLEIKNWVEQEISYLTPRLVDNGKFIAFEKITTGLSAGEWAVLINLLIEGKIITETNKMKIYNAFARIIITEGTDQVSVESLRSRAINMKQTHIDSMVTHVWKLLDLARSMHPKNK